MPIEIDSNSIRVIGNNVAGIRFYDDDRVLRHDIYLKDDNSLNISGTLAATYSTSAPDSSGGFDVGAQHTWTGQQTFMATMRAQDIIPQTADAYDIGAAGNLWRKAYISELETTLFAANTITVSGARQVWGHDCGAIAAYLSDTADTCDFGMAMTAGDFVEMRGYGQVEYFEVGANVAGTVYKIGADASGARDLDGSGANIWPAGTPFLVLGASGDGRVEIDASGPRISIYEQGATYDANTETVRIGNMRALFGTGANDRWGIGIGDYAGGNYLSYNAETADTFVLSAGGGAVALDPDGLSIELSDAFAGARSVRFVSSGADVCWLQGYEQATARGIGLYTFAPDTQKNVETQIVSQCLDYSSGDSRYASASLMAQVYGQANEYVKFTVFCQDSFSAAYAQLINAPLYINESACADLTLGLVINQGANDDAALVLKSSDVDHGITDNAETDTYGVLMKAHATGGGLRVRGMTDTDADPGGAIRLQGILGEAADTTKGTGGRGVVEVISQVKSGTGATTVGADGNLLAVRNGATTRFIFDAEGSAHADVEWTTYDEHDDAALLDNLETTLTDWQRNPVKAEFGQWLTEEAAQLEALGIVHFDRDNPGHAMVNTTRLSMLLVGALRQMSARLNELEAQ